MSDLQTLRNALTVCRDTFAKYAEWHAAKNTASGEKKAARNAELARMCDEALGGDAPPVVLLSDLDAELVKFRARFGTAG